MTNPSIVTSEGEAIELESPSLTPGEASTSGGSEQDMINIATSLADIAHQLHFLNLQLNDFNSNVLAHGLPVENHNR